MRKLLLAVTIVLLLAACGGSSDAQLKALQASEKETNALILDVYGCTVRTLGNNLVGQFSATRTGSKGSTQDRAYVYEETFTYDCPASVTVDGKPLHGNSYTVHTVAVSKDGIKVDGR